LQPGNELIAAGYALYDAACVLVLSTGLGVNGFTLDPSLGEFILSHKNIRIPKRGKIYSINEANSLEWDEPTKEWINNFKKKKASSRYVGAMAGDVHRTLLYGGVFSYVRHSRAQIESVCGGAEQRIRRYPAAHRICSATMANRIR
jgi:fructose-1,6-bisphosphatase I